ncbi:MAG: hypothetical protein ABIO39_06345 [Caulobacteraceae bacterium]
MTEEEKRLAKRRGRPATGRGQTVGVRMQPGQLAALDAWIAGQSEPFTRPEAIRAMVAAMLELMARNEATAENHGRGASDPGDDSAALQDFLDRFEAG